MSSSQVSAIRRGVAIYHRALAIWNDHYKFADDEMVCRPTKDKNNPLWQHLQQIKLLPTSEEQDVVNEILSDPIIIPSIPSFPTTPQAPVTPQAPATPQAPTTPKPKENPTGFVLKPVPLPPPSTPSAPTTASEVYSPATPGRFPTTPMTPGSDINLFSISPSDSLMSLDQRSQTLSSTPFTTPSKSPKYKRDYESMSMEGSEEVSPSGTPEYQPKIYGASKSLGSNMSWSPVKSQSPGARYAMESVTPEKSSDGFISLPDDFKTPPKKKKKGKLKKLKKKKN